MLNKDQLLREFVFKSVRSGGSGGQHVNKVSTKVEISFDIMASYTLTERQKGLLLKKLATHITKEGILRVAAQESRSQTLNKEKALKKIFTLIEKALKPEKKRIATKPGKAVKEKRLEKKKLVSEKKKLRRWKTEI